MSSPAEPSSVATNDERCRFRFPDKAECSVLRGEHHKLKSHPFVAPKAVAPTSIPNSMVTNCHRCGKKAVLVSSGPLVGCPQGVSTLRCPDDECFRIQMDDAMKQSQQVQAIATHRNYEEELAHLRGMVHHAWELIVLRFPDEADRDELTAELYEILNDEIPNHCAACAIPAYTDFIGHSLMAVLRKESAT